MEKWRPVPEFPDRYLVSDLGRVYALARMVIYRDGRSYFRPGRTLKANIRSDGYHAVKLGYRRDEYKAYKVASLVLSAFVGARPDGMEVLHWDDDRSNDWLSNLRYGTRSENLHDSVRNGRHPAANKTHCIRNHPFSVENTRIAADGHRSCRECARMWKRIYRSEGRVA